MSGLSEKEAVNILSSHEIATSESHSAGMLWETYERCLAVLGADHKYIIDLRNKMDIVGAPDWFYQKAHAEDSENFRWWAQQILEERGPEYEHLTNDDKQRYDGHIESAERHERLSKENPYSFSGLKNG
jgi:hypothetical protein